MLFNSVFHISICQFKRPFNDFCSNSVKKKYTSIQNKTINLCFMFVLYDKDSLYLNAGVSESSMFSLMLVWQITELQDNLKKDSENYY